MNGSRFQRFSSGFNNGLQNFRTGSNSFFSGLGNRFSNTKRQFFPTNTNEVNALINGDPNKLRSSCYAFKNGQVGQNWDPSNKSIFSNYCRQNRYAGGKKRTKKNKRHQKHRKTSRRYR